MSLAGHRAIFAGYRGPKRLVNRLDELDALARGGPGSGVLARQSAFNSVESRAR
jgi:hypothetical protein